MLGLCFVRRQDARRLTCLQNACNGIFNGGLDFGVIGIAHMAQRRRQVSGANEHAIDTRRVGNRVEIF
ncbi:MAG: hypothetical protein RI896_448 [Pseudomonadota bacterium]